MKIKFWLQIFAAIFMCISISACGEGNIEDIEKEEDKEETIGSPSEIPNNIIYYTTNDDIVIRFRNDDVFGEAVILSNSYSSIDGYGTIHFATDVTAIEACAFSLYRNLEYGVYQNLQNDNLTSLVLPNTITSIGDNAFVFCSNLAKISLSSRTKSIGDAAFYGCANLDSLIIPDNVTHIGEEVFVDCENLTSISIPDNVISLGFGIFANCSKLRIATIGNGVADIPNKTFELCKNLESITLGNNLQTIGNNAFIGCEKLTSISIPNNVTTIGKNAFYNCEKLTSLILGKKIKYIGSSAFKFCYLKDVYSYAILPPYLEKQDEYLPFTYGTQHAVTLHVPKGCIDAYKSSDWGKIFSNIVEI